VVRSGIVLDEVQDTAVFSLQDEREQRNFQNHTNEPTMLLKTKEDDLLSHDVTENRRVNRFSHDITENKRLNSIYGVRKGR
jgi:hypothetical protein